MFVDPAGVGGGVTGVPGAGSAGLVSSGIVAGGVAGAAVVSVALGVAGGTDVSVALGTAGGVVAGATPGVPGSYVAGGGVCASAPLGIVCAPPISGFGLGSALAAETATARTAGTTNKESTFIVPSSPTRSTRFSVLDMSIVALSTRTGLGAWITAQPQRMVPFSLAEL
jgi:hypothetical protein